MSLEFILASGNSHKAEEFSELFDKDILKVKAASEKLDIVEDGTTFHENALLKAKGYFKEFGGPVLADDSGLCVEALPEELGILTARFGGEGLSSEERAKLLLERMKGLPDEKRKAYFVCVLCFYFSDDEYFFFEGRVDGKVGTEYKGDFGFGYDPVFHPTGENEHSTLAMLPKWKKFNSHRARACQEAQKFFHNRICHT